MTKKVPEVSEDTRELAARMQLNVGRLARAIRSHGVSELTPSQMSALATISDLGPMRMSEVAAREAIGAPLTTRIVASLEDLGYVKKIQDREDKRAFLVKTTSSGVAVLTNVRNARTAGLAIQLEGLSNSEIQILEKSFTVIEKMIGERKRTQQIEEAKNS
ncbi:MAG: MarR family transcriptional regulator [Actinomycetota bacterium]